MTEAAHPNILGQVDIFESDDGDTWWIDERVDDATAIAKFREMTAEYYDSDEIADSDLCVTRGWWHDAHDPTDDERWETCEATDDEAEPFTRIEL